MIAVAVICGAHRHAEPVAGKSHGNAASIWNFGADHGTYDSGRAHGFGRRNRPTKIQWRLSRRHTSLLVPTESDSDQYAQYLHNLGPGQRALLHAKYPPHVRKSEGFRTEDACSEVHSTGRAARRRSSTLLGKPHRTRIEVPGFSKADRLAELQVSGSVVPAIHAVVHHCRGRAHQRVHGTYIPGERSVEGGGSTQAAVVRVAFCRGDRTQGSCL